MIAAFGHFEVRGRRGCRDEPGQKVVLGLGVELQAHRVMAGPCIVEQLDDAGIRAGSDDAVDLRNERLKLVAETL